MRPNHQNKALATGLPVRCVQYIIHLTAAAKAFTPQGRSNFPRLNNNEKAIRGRSQTSTGHKPFCSLSLTELSLFTRGRKFVGSRRNVISSDWRNLFIPVRSDCGLRRYDSNQVFQYTIQGQKNYVRCGGGSDGRTALKDNDAVSEISCHYEIVLDDKGRLLRM